MQRVGYTTSDITLGKPRVKYSSTLYQEMIEDLNFAIDQTIITPEGQHRNIWKNYHPNESLTPNDIIHHINGNHIDNRPNNLMKVTQLQHKQLHKELHKNKQINLGLVQRPAVYKPLSTT